jgi:hypothetical protein
MNNRALLLQEISATSDDMIAEVLNFLRYLKVKDAGIDIEDLIDSNELHQAMINSEGFITPEELLTIRPLKLTAIAQPPVPTIAFQPFNHQDHRS